MTQTVDYNRRYSTIVDLEVNRIVWMDMEMTGLDVDNDQIMEVACLVTDSDLRVIAEGPDIAIQHSKDVLSKMNDWCQKQHEKTGLVNLCLNSKIKLEEAEQMVLEFLQEHVTYKMSPLAGNSVYMDRMFLIKHMPKVHDYLHYRIIDVSTLKEICRRWNPELFKQVPNKIYGHRALQDIRESVEELLFYKKHFLKASAER
ncbi:probable oligoribonuclease isoform X2 [Cylas formicarius]|uniref:probable oligoribonuclease isoform X2 n=1 Tax=Cylas formicarius TaxID=197179 RepID=UPI002958782F|nr:probable oligoribonuclease isoform X2 [Cylas formicarius]